MTVEMSKACRKNECETKADCNKNRETQKRLQWRGMAALFHCSNGFSCVISLPYHKYIVFGWVGRYKRRFARTLACAYTATLICVALFQGFDIVVFAAGACVLLGSPFCCCYCSSFFVRRRKHTCGSATVGIATAPVRTKLAKKQKRNAVAVKCDYVHAIEARALASYSRSRTLSLYVSRALDVWIWFFSSHLNFHTPFPQFHCFLFVTVQYVLNERIQSHKIKRNIKLSQRDFDVAFLIFTSGKNDQRKREGEQNKRVDWNEMESIVSFFLSSSSNTQKVLIKQKE